MDFDLLPIMISLQVLCIGLIVVTMTWFNQRLKQQASTNKLKLENLVKQELANKISQQVNEYLQKALAKPEIIQDQIFENAQSQIDEKLTTITNRFNENLTQHLSKLDDSLQNQTERAQNELVTHIDKLKAEFDTYFQEQVTELNQTIKDIVTQASKDVAAKKLSLEDHIKIVENQLIKD